MHNIYIYIKTRLLFPDNYDHPVNHDGYIQLANLPNSPNHLLALDFCLPDVEAARLKEGLCRMVGSSVCWLVALTLTIFRVFK